MRKPKFKLDDIVCMKDDFHFNPASKSISIGKIESIHIHKIYKKRDLLLPEYHITYSVSGFSLRPGEEQLKFYKEDSND